MGTALVAALELARNARGGATLAPSQGCVMRVSRRRQAAQVSVGAGLGRRMTGPLIDLAVAWGD